MSLLPKIFRKGKAGADEQTLRLRASNMLVTADHDDKFGDAVQGMSQDDLLELAAKQAGQSETSGGFSLKSFLSIVMGWFGPASAEAESKVDLGNLAMQVQSRSNLREAEVTHDINSRRNNLAQAIENSQRCGKDGAVISNTIRSTELAQERNAGRIAVEQAKGAEAAAKNEAAIKAAQTETRGIRNTSTGAIAARAAEVAAVKEAVTARTAGAAASTSATAAANTQAALRSASTAAQANSGLQTSSGAVSAEAANRAQAQNLAAEVLSRQEQSTANGKAIVQPQIQTQAQAQLAQQVKAAATEQHGSQDRRQLAENKAQQEQQEKNLYRQVQQEEKDQRHEARREERIERANEGARASQSGAGNEGARTSAPIHDDPLQRGRIDAHTDGEKSPGPGIAKADTPKIDPTGHTSPPSSTPPRSRIDSNMTSAHSPAPLAAKGESIGNPISPDASRSKSRFDTRMDGANGGLAARSDPQIEKPNSPPPTNRFDSHMQANASPRTLAPKSDAQQTSNPKAQELPHGALTAAAELKIALGKGTLMNVDDSFKPAPAAHAPMPGGAGIGLMS